MNTVLTIICIILLIFFGIISNLTKKAIFRGAKGPYLELVYICSSILSFIMLIVVGARIFA